MKRMILNIVGRTVSSIRNANWTLIEFNFWFFAAIILFTFSVAMKLFHDKDNFIALFMTFASVMNARISAVKLRKKELTKRVEELENQLANKPENNIKKFNITAKPANQEDKRIILDK